MSLQQVPKLYPWCKPVQWLPFRYQLAVKLPKYINELRYNK